MECSKPETSQTPRWYHCLECDYSTNKLYHAKMHHQRIHQNGGKPIKGKRKFQTDTLCRKTVDTAFALQAHAKEQEKRKRASMRTVVLFGENRVSFRDFGGNLTPANTVGASLSFQKHRGREVLLFSDGS